MLGHSVGIFTKHDFQVSQVSVETLLGTLCTKFYQNQLSIIEDVAKHIIFYAMAEAELLFLWHGVIIIVVMW